MRFGRKQEQGEAVLIEEGTPIEHAMAAVVCELLKEDRDMTLVSNTLDVLVDGPRAATRSALFGALFACQNLALLVADDNPELAPRDLIEALFEKVRLDLLGRGQG